MLTSDFKECFFWIFKPLNYLFSDFFDFLFGVFATNSTFPNKTNTPTLLLVIFEIFSIPLFVTGKLLFPEFLIRLRKNKVGAVFMGVPEAAVYENYCKISGKNKVRFSRIPFVADTISKTSLEKGRTNLFFRLSIL